MGNIVVLSTWSIGYYNYELVYSHGADKYSVLRIKDRARFGLYDSEADAKLALYKAKAVAI